MYTYSMYTTSKVFKELLFIEKKICPAHHFKSWVSLNEHQWIVTT